MAVTIKRGPEPSPAPAAPQEKPEPPRKGVHLRASVAERKIAHDYTGGAHGPLCNTGDGHYQSTCIGKGVTCPCCIAYMRDRLKYEITEEQEGLLNAAGS